DGVNIASRLQAAAEAGAIYISDVVFHNVSNKKGINTRFVKEDHLKNVKQPVKIYEVEYKKNKATNGAIKTIPPKSIAVLPFVNMSNDPEQEYFCDGISEEIINALAQLNNLRVIARTSAFSFKDKNVDVREIGKTLNVSTLLEGSVRKSGNKLRITTQLINVADGSHLWANRYDRDMQDIFSIQEDIAQNVATSLRGVLTNEEKEAIRRPETTIVQAYEYFLKGRQLFHQLELRESIKYFRKALELDPEYALAYAGLADAHAWLYEWEGAKNTDLVAATTNSKKALELAPNLSESHSSHGFALSLCSKYDEAAQEFTQAIRLNSNSYDAFYYYARLCFARGHMEQSADLFLKASEVRREDFQSILLLGQVYRVLNSDKAEDAFIEGVKRLRKYVELNPDDIRALSFGAGALLEIGNRDEAYQWMNRALELDPRNAGVLINGSCLFAKAGDKERALDVLERAVDLGYGKKDWMENDPDYDNIRHESRFKELMERIR
ncbi:MAG TPA: tetratricopeptide repeat protein, partial [Parafilimonas sp.]|nr:tetratricopeptide repeat protein [Parafilimonas sp.]